MFDSMKDYGKWKTRTLGAQFNAEQKRDLVLDIFHGVTVWVDGYSNPSALEIKDLMKKYGGKYEHFFRAKRGITHIITNSYPDCKVGSFKNFIVVKPDWITDSIKEKRRLPEEKYLLRNPSGAKMQAEMFGPYMMTQADDEDFCYSGELMSQVPAQKSPVPKQGVQRSPMKLNKEEENVMHDCTKPEFLENYFSLSRLHHLSAWKQQWQQELSAFLFKEAQQKEQQSKGVDGVKDDKPLVTFGEHMQVTRSVYMHVDIDCFFVSVTVREHPELRGLPVVVCHGSLQSSEIACASYEARQFGIRNGMCFAMARERCPSVIAAPYAFDAYEATSKQLYQILLSRTHNVQVVSCDEALIEITELCKSTSENGESLSVSAERVAEGIRREFLEKTLCTCSIGIGLHPLAARVACSLAKPDGVHTLMTAEDTRIALAPLELDAIPTIGWSIKDTLNTMLGIRTCAELASASLVSLEGILGKKRAATIQGFARGLDTRTVVRFRTRASVGLCVTWGIRLKDQEGVNKLMTNFAGELCKRLKQLEVAGSALMFSWKVRSKNAPPPGKFLGHGRTDDYSKTITFDAPANSVPVISAALIREIGQFQERHSVPATELRGFSVSMSRLVSESSLNRLKIGPPKQQSMIQGFAVPTTASQVNVNHRARAAPPTDEDSIIDLTSIATQAVPKVSKKHSRGRKHPVNVEVQPQMRSIVHSEESIIISDDDEDDDIINDVVAKKKARIVKEQQMFLPSKKAIDFDNLHFWLAEETKDGCAMNPLYERILQARINSLLSHPSMDMDSALQLLRLLRFYCNQPQVDVTWKSALKRLIEAANTLVASTLGIHSSCVLSI